jgi:hypothetical protein
MLRVSNWGKVCTQNTKAETLHLRVKFDEAERGTARDCRCSLIPRTYGYIALSPESSDDQCPCEFLRKECNTYYTFALRQLSNYTQNLVALIKKMRILYDLNVFYFPLLAHFIQTT